MALTHLGTVTKIRSVASLNNQLFSEMSPFTKRLLHDQLNKLKKNLLFVILMFLGWRGLGWEEGFSAQFEVLTRVSYHDKLTMYIYCLRTFKSDLTHNGDKLSSSVPGQLLSRLHCLDLASFGAFLKYLLYYKNN